MQNNENPDNDAGAAGRRRFVAIQLEETVLLLAVVYLIHGYDRHRVSHTNANSIDRFATQMGFSSLRSVLLRFGTRHCIDNGYIAVSPRGIRFVTTAGRAFVTSFANENGDSFGWTDQYCDSVIRAAVLQDEARLQAEQEAVDAFENMG